MLKFIASLFFILIVILNIQFTLDVAPHYGTRNYIPTSATILEQSVNNTTEYTYNINLIYSYSINNRTYLNNHIQTEDLLFNTNEKAKHFLDDYKPGQAIAVFYNPQDYRQSYLFKGLTKKDWNIFTLLFGFNIISFFLLYIAFLFNWQFNNRNQRLTAFGSGLCGNVVISLVSHLAIVFLYRIEASSNMLVLIFVCHIIAFLCSFIFQKITTQTLHKYHRLDNDNICLTLNEEHEYTESGLLKIKKEGSGNIYVINILAILLLSFTWANNQFLLTNHLLYAIGFSILLNLFSIYVFSLKKKKYYNPGFTEK